MIHIRHTFFIENFTPVRTNCMVTNFDAHTYTKTSSNNNYLPKQNQLLESIQYKYFFNVSKRNTDVGLFIQPNPAHA